MTVKFHVDYSTKYGLGYELSDGSQGVYFNDSTVLSFQPFHLIYYYFDDPSHS